MGIFYFWLSSRYPDLNAKSLMAHSASVADTLSPWPLFQVQASDAFVTKILLTTINWVNSNLKGMAFGIGLGAAFLTLFSYLKLPDRPGRFRNTFYGFLLGTPLGVCVNCAAPVFKGILESRRLEMAMATMLSSPTMNIIVLTMVFTLFPFYMGVVKVIFTLCCIFIGIPLIGKIVGSKHSQVSASTWLNKTPEASCAIFKAEKWHEAVVGTLKDYWQKLRFIGVRLIPLMLLAGFLGSILSHLLPNSIFETEVGFLTILLASLFGILLPIPIAFDVILVNAFYAQGLAESIVLVLLCSLGIMSIFSMMVVWSSVSKQWAIGLMFFCFSLSVVVGLSAEQLHQQFYVQAKIDEFQNVQNETVSVTEDKQFMPNLNALESNKHIEFKTIREDNHAIISVAPFFQSEPYDQPFEKLEGFEIGLNRGFQYGIRDYTDPFWVGRGTAAGDYDKDGWPDILFGSNHGFILYHNNGGVFNVQKQPNKKISQFQVFAVAFVDMDNDGWLDIFFTTFNHGNYVVHNRQGEFDYQNLQNIPNNQAVLTVSPAFADIDQNGLLDVVNGNMALGVVTGSNHLLQQRNNSIVFNGGTEFRDVPLEQTSGETMSSLVSDMNNDGQLDIYFANDFIVPDKLLLGTGAGFKQVKGNELLSSTPFFSMSVDSGDINNDLSLDLFTGGTTVVSSELGSVDIDGVNPEDYSQFKGDDDTCLTIVDSAFRENCLNVRKSNYIDILDQKRNVDFDKCYLMKGEIEQQRCLLTVMWHLVTQNPSIKDCKINFSRDERLEAACKVLKHQQRRYTDSDLVNALAQEDRSLLYQFDDKSKSFSEVEGFKHPGGWTWNGKIVDLDNDGWQDVINAEGAVRRSGYGWNVFMKNNQGNHFSQKQFSFGLTDNFGLFSFAMLDMDNDGDLDIIGNAAEGPVQVYRNHSTTSNHSIAISLVDNQGNSHAIGAKIIVFYHDGKEKQIREIKASGGYMSFDPATAYFGLGENDVVDEIEVRWPNNVINSYPGPFSSDNHYRIERF